MNIKHILAIISTKSFSGNAPLFGKTSRAFNLLSLIIVAMLVISAAVNVKAVCQTPQFALPVVLSVTRPVAVASGDFNRDGNIDLAVLRSNPGTSPPGTVEFFLGNGNGNFVSTGILYSALTGGVSDLAAADFNKDGKLDVAAVGSNPSVAAILLGNGNGGFSSPTNFSLSTSPASIAVGDFNNDNKVDIAVKNAIFGQGVSILPGLGNGSFGSAINFPTGQGGSAPVVLQDFNHDGFLDFATVNTFSPQDLSVRLGNGSFFFTDPIQSIAEPGARDLTVNDFNRDGQPDILIARNKQSPDAALLLGVGDGTFVSPVSSPFFLTNNPQSVTSADFNSDRIPDAAFGNTSTTNSLSILLNNGAGGFSSPFNASPETGESKKVYALDYNKNGATDLVIVKEITQNKVVLLRNTCPPPNKPQFDFDGDGKSDLAVFRPTGGAWFLQQSAAGFAGVGFGLGTDLITPADFDGDGKTDIAVFRPSNGTWYLQQSQAGFTAVQFGQDGDIPMPADFDGDGKADVAVFRPSNGAWYLLRSRDGFTGVQFGQAGDKPAAADYDGDGKADIAVVRQTNGASIWYIFSSSQGFYGVQFGTDTDKLAPADYDGDGKTDIAVYRPSNGVWYLLRSQQGFTGISFGTAEDIPVAADYDGDGKADIAVFRPSNGVWYLLQSQSGFTGVQFGTANDRPIPAAFAP